MQNISKLLCLLCTLFLSYASFPQILCSQNLLESHFMVLLFCEFWEFLWNRREYLEIYSTKSKCLECFLYPFISRVFTYFSLEISLQVVVGWKEVKS